MVKFGFRIQTRSGVKVENLLIQARDQAEAERRLGQMYLGCQILECQVCETEGRRTLFSQPAVSVMLAGSR